MLGMVQTISIWNSPPAAKLRLCIKDKPFVDFMKDMLKEMGMDEDQIKQMEEFEMKITYKTTAQPKMEMNVGGG